MTRKRTPHKEQSRRFIEAAREIGTDESPDAFERVFGKLVPPKRGSAQDAPESKDKRRPRRKSASALLGGDRRQGKSGVE